MYLNQGVKTSSLNNFILSTLGFRPSLRFTIIVNSAPIHMMQIVGTFEIRSKWLLKQPEGSP